MWDLFKTGIYSLLVLLFVSWLCYMSVSAFKELQSYELERKKNGVIIYD